MYNESKVHTIKHNPGSDLFWPQRGCALEKLPTEIKAVECYNDFKKKFNETNVKLTVNVRRSKTNQLSLFRYVIYCKYQFVL